MWTSQVMRVDPQGLCRIWHLRPPAQCLSVPSGQVTGQLTIHLHCCRCFHCTAAGAATAQLPVQTLHWPRCPSAQQLLHLMLVLLRASFCTRAISSWGLEECPFFTRFYSANLLMSIIATYFCVNSNYFDCKLSKLFDYFKANTILSGMLSKITLLV